MTRAAMAELRRMQENIHAGGCPSCGAKRGYSTELDLPRALSMRQCRKCGAWYGGSMYRGEFDAMFFGPTHRKGCEYAPDGSEESCRREAEHLRYLSLDILGSNGVSHFHGWICRDCLGVVQVG